MNEQKKKNGFKDKIMLVVDICFVVVLCIVVLFTTMMIQNMVGTTDVSGGYEILPQTLIPVIVAIVGYLIFLVKKGKKSLKEIVDIAYEGKKGEDE